MGTVKPDQLTSQLNQWFRLLICYMRNDPYCLILSLLGGSVCCLWLPLSPQFIWDLRLFGWCFGLSCPPSHICAHPSSSNKQSVLSEHLNPTKQPKDWTRRLVQNQTHHILSHQTDHFASCLLWKTQKTNVSHQASLSCSSWDSNTLYRWCW